MRNKVILTVSLALVILGTASMATANVPPQINYQGHLTDSDGSPLDTTISMTFAIYDDSSTGSLVLWTETQTGVEVSAGLFNVLLGVVTPIPDTVFVTDWTWLGIQVGYDPEISPRTKLVSVPYAFQTLRVATVDGATGGDIYGDLRLHSYLYVGDLAGEPGFLVIRDGSTNTITAYGSSGSLNMEGNLDISGKATLGWGSTNTGADAFVAGRINEVSGDYATIGGGFGNSATGQRSVVGGGMYNLAGSVNATVAGGYSDTAQAPGATVGGGSTNQAVGDYSTVGGGLHNTASESYGTVSGGRYNTADLSMNTVGGGQYNTAGGSQSTIGGGAQNAAIGPNSTIGGGDADTAAGNGSTIGGGSANVAIGFRSTIGGGENNSADSSYATVAGGATNAASNSFSVVGGGEKNLVEGQHSAILGGYADSITSTASYSYLFGVKSKLTEDSTFMVDMPHVRFGDEDSGYEFPTSDGGNGQVMTTDGDGKLSWTDVSGVGDNDWTYRVTDGADTNLVMGGPWGLSRYGNNLYGSKDSTHVNLGQQSTTGSDGFDYGHCAVGGGLRNTAANSFATVGGGYGNTAGNTSATVGGGYSNTASGENATVAGGLYNKARGENSVVGGGGGSLSDSNAAIGDYSTVSGGQRNVASALRSTVGGGWRNTANGVASTVGGGDNNTASGGGTVSGGWFNAASGSYATVGGGYYDTASASYTTVSGGDYNTASLDYATVAGGQQNTADDWWSTVSGGRVNYASGSHATVSGGWADTATGSFSTIGGGEINKATNLYCTIGGGRNNTASGERSTVAGGSHDTASGAYSAVGGGYANAASGDYATVPGGWRCAAAGEYSFAAGNTARANHNGSVVISANSYAWDTVSTGGVEQMVLRADGGLYITNTAEQAPYDNTNLITTRGGAYLSGNGTDWTNSSDKNQKENFAPVSGVEILEKISALPITRWNYKGEEAGITHIGPTAQDFYAIFGVGKDDKSISTIDPAGIALAGMKELIFSNQQLAQENQELREMLEEFKQRIGKLEKEN